MTDAKKVVREIPQSSQPSASADPVSTGTPVQTPVASADNSRDSSAKRTKLLFSVRTSTASPSTSPKLTSGDEQHAKRHFFFSLNVLSFILSKWAALW